jgi:asparagine synthetase B (glutamine-hydrolysing)
MHRLSILDLASGRQPMMTEAQFSLAKN